MNVSTFFETTVYFPTPTFRLKNNNEKWTFCLQNKRTKLLITQGSTQKRTFF